MPYEVTATRKRPQTFDQLAGQEFVVSTLKNSVAQHKVAHAYIFSGPRGVGKTSAARILAKSLNCLDDTTNEACGVCNNCLEITSGNSLDVIEIDGASNTSVNDVREIKDEVLFSPNKSKFKVFIIDEVHMLSNSAFNALLKTIEEPPPYIVFIFATTEIHKVPATIRSRCQQFNFRLIPIETIKKHLETACVDLQIQADSDALYWIAKEATGSLRDAYTLFDQIASFSDSKITLDIIRDKLGIVGIDQINQLCELLAKGHTKQALEFTNEIIDQGVSVDQFVIDLCEFFRSILFLKNKIERESILGLNPQRISPEILKNFSTTQLEQGIKLIFNLHRDIRYSLNQKFELELLVCRLSSLKNYLDSASLMKKIESLRNELANGALSHSATSPSDNIADDTAAEWKAPENFMKSLVASVKPSKVTLAAVLESVISWEFRNNTLVLLFESEFSVNLANENRAFLIDSIQELSGQELDLIIEKIVDKATTAEEKKILDEPLEMLKNVFKGEVIEEEE